MSTPDTQTTTTLTQWEKLQKEHTASPLDGMIAEATYNEWLKKYPLGIYAVVVEGRIAFFYKPNLVMANYIASLIEVGKPFEHLKTLANETILGGCGEILTNDQYFLGVSAAFEKALNGPAARVINF